MGFGFSLPLVKRVAMTSCLDAAWAWLGTCKVFLGVPGRMSCHKQYVLTYSDAIVAGDRGCKDSDL